MNWTFRVVTFVIGVGLVAGAVVIARPRPLDVDTAIALRGPLEEKVIDDGRARVRQRYTVSAPVAGTLARIELHEGDAVEPGMELARLLPLASPLLDPQTRRAAEERLASSIDVSSQAKASVDRAQIASDQAARERTRIESLVKAGALGASELDRADTEARMRAAELSSITFASKVAAHDIDQARATLARFTPGTGRAEQLAITSSVHGQVLHVLRQSEGVVSAGTALLEVGDPTALELVADVLSQDAVGVHPGMPAAIVHWGGPLPLAAKVRRVDPAAFTKVSALGVDEQRVNVVLDLDAASLGDAGARGNLGDGYAVEIEITVWSKPDALQIPTSALFRDGGGWSVFVVSNGKASRREVEPGHRGPLATEVRSGIGEGDRVIIHPGAAVHDGTAVSYR